MVVLLCYRLILLSGHPSLPSYQCALAMQWLLYFTQDAPEVKVY